MGRPEPDHDREMDRQGDRETEQQEVHATLPKQPPSFLDQITDPFGEVRRIHARIGIRTGRRRGVGVVFCHPWSHSSIVAHYGRIPRRPCDSLPGTCPIE